MKFPESSAHRAAMLIGALSLASGALMAKSPRTMARVYGFPGSAKLVRWLGARDVLIGALLWMPKTRRLAALARAASDAADAQLLRHEAARRGRGAPIRASLALVSASLSSLLAARLP